MSRRCYRLQTFYCSTAWTVLLLLLLLLLLRLLLPISICHQEAAIFYADKSSAGNALRIIINGKVLEFKVSIGRMSHVKRHTSHVTRHTSHVTRHTSHVTRHTSHVTRHTSHGTRHTSLDLQGAQNNFFNYFLTHNLGGKDFTLHFARCCCCCCCFCCCCSRVLIDSRGYYEPLYAFTCSITTVHDMQAPPPPTATAPHSPGRVT